MADLLTADGLARLHKVAAGHVGADQVPGLVVLVGRGGQVHAEALGSLTIGGPAVQRDSLFRIASMTKPVTGVATLALAAEGLFRLDEPVDRLLPELANRRVLRRMDGPLSDTVPAHRAIIVRDLLNYTFGFGDEWAMFFAAEPWPVMAEQSRLRLATLGPPDLAHQPDPDTWIAGLGSLPLLAQPGERWFYNTSASVLGVLCARATGQPFGDVLRSRVFEPLGMRDTGFWTTETSRLATAYEPAAGGLRVWDEPAGIFSQPPPFGDGAAGLLSTADDLLAFSRMLLRGGAPVLAADAVAEMTRDQLTPEQKSYGGLGPGFFDGTSWGYSVAVVTAGERAGAFGWAGGFGSTWLADPARDLTVLVLTQRTLDGPGGHPLHDEVQAAAYAALG
jgi:CubicO group peptidase (beta-lactamase class C family)